MKKVFKEIRQRAKQPEVQELLKLSEQKLSMREKATKARLAAAKTNAKDKSYWSKYYEQFVEL
ncbi:MAG: hypothetical protein GX892_02975 [Thermoanaerobacteraceae bacterium]|nr:hypothetical protein [Thermoanaerobacteraceae bacterium]